MFMGDPQEMLAEAQRQADLLGMQVDQKRHDIVTSFDSMTLDQLAVLESIFTAISGQQDPDGRILANWYACYCAQEKRRRFNVCLSCGKDHDAELAAVDVPK